MGGESKRRKLQDIGKEEEKDEEAGETMKQFFDLIQNTKVMRDRINSKKLAKDREKSKAVWNPKFQPEDFIEDGYGKNESNITLPLTAASSSTAKQSNQKEEEEEEEQQEQEDKQQVVEEQKGLDLNLSL